MTLPPECATVPSARTTVIPITRSRTAPYLRRRGPESAVATNPPTVAPGPALAGSTPSHWPVLARRFWRSATGTPASTATVMSAASWARIRLRSDESATRSTEDGGAPQSSFEPLPRNSSAASSRAAARSSSAAASTESGRAVRARAAAKPELFRSGSPRRRSPADEAGTARLLRRTGAASGRPCLGCRCSEDQRPHARGPWSRGRLP